eukprot:2755622-Amphidinium_carterae.1
MSLSFCFRISTRTTDKGPPKTLTCLMIDEKEAKPWKQTNDQADRLDRVSKQLLNRIELPGFAMHGLLSSSRDCAFTSSGQATAEPKAR